MKAHFWGLMGLAFLLTAAPARALNDDWLKDDQAFLQNQISQYGSELARMEDLKQSANISKFHIGAGNGSASDYTNVALWEAQRSQYQELQRQMRQAEHALRKVNNRINKLGTTIPPQKHDPYAGGHGACGGGGGGGACGGSGGSGSGNGQMYYEKSSPTGSESSSQNTSNSNLKRSQNKMVGARHTSQTSTHHTGQHQIQHQTSNQMQHQTSNQMQHHNQQQAYVQQQGHVQRQSYHPNRQNRRRAHQPSY